ncbi:MAG: chemotaxis protein CheR [Firmicutes bacterium HGW-Firmicutes-15]|nr:MAG: chemotaxis protein CheR [Firmicutes bacterium HGW-Firmicutes-15]
MNGATASKEFLMIQKLIEDKCGIVLGQEKAFLLESKLSKMLEESDFMSFDDLYRKICYWNDPEIVDLVIEAVTIKETFWFRDKTPWQILEELLLPTYIKELRDGSRDKVRIWSAACSYGQEPYSVAMCIDNYLEREGFMDIKLSSFEILATDISRTALQTAEAGIFDNISILRGLDDHYKYRYFQNKGRIWRIDDRIKESIQFRQFNLINEFFEKFDLIFFRNVLMYFSERLKKEMLNKINMSLDPHGIFFIGSSELLNDYNLYFSMEHYKNGIYFKAK